MSHSFLLESGSWIIQGYWLDSTQNSIPVTGGTIITWEDANWFTTKTKLVFPNSDRQEIIYEYKGNLPSQQLQYTYVLKHSELGKIEGEGWIGVDSIVQRYWLLGDSRRRNGFETFFCIDENTYSLSSGIMTGNHLISTMEAILERSS